MGKDVEFEKCELDQDMTKYDVNEDLKQSLETENDGGIPNKLTPEYFTENLREFLYRSLKDKNELEAFDMIMKYFIENRRLFSIKTDVIYDQTISADEGKCTIRIPHAWLVQMGCSEQFSKLGMTFDIERRCITIVPASNNIEEELFDK